MNDMLFISMMKSLSVCQSSQPIPPSTILTNLNPCEIKSHLSLSISPFQVNQAKTLSGERQGTGAGLFIGRPRISGI